MGGCTFFLKGLVFLLLADMQCSKNGARICLLYLAERGVSEMYMGPIIRIFVWVVSTDRYLTLSIYLAV